MRKINMLEHRNNEKGLLAFFFRHNSKKPLPGWQHHKHNTTVHLSYHACRVRKGAKNVTFHYKRCKKGQRTSEHVLVSTGFWDHAGGRMLCERLPLATKISFWRHANSGRNPGLSRRKAGGNDKFRFFYHRTIKM